MARRSRAAEDSSLTLISCASTATLRPWKIVLYVAFDSRIQAQRFERYLKSGSGHAFANRHFWS